MIEVERTWEAADDAVRNGRFLEAVNILKRLASSGQWIAFAELGNLYEHGGGELRQDYEEALYWYRRAIADADSPHAHLGLARMYFFGHGLPQDHLKARDHCVKALAVPPPVGLDVRCRIVGILILGSLYRNGIGLERDSLSARELYDEGIREGLPIVIREYAKLEFEERRYLRGVLYFLRALRAAVRLGFSDKNHPKLTGVRDMELPNSPRGVYYLADRAAKKR